MPLTSIPLFASGLFFFYPWKIFFNAALGSDFTIALRHFKRDHRGWTNIGLHIVCLVFQLGGNFALLNAIDMAIPQITGWETLRWFSALSALMWILTLTVLSAPCPVAVRVASALCVAAAYHTAPLVADHAGEAWLFAAFLAVLVGDVLLNRTPSNIGLVMCTLTGVGLYLTHTQTTRLRESLGAPLAKHQLEMWLGTLTIASLLSLRRNAVAPVAIVTTLLSRTFYVLGAHPAMFFYGCAFYANLLQGVSHALTKEKATMIALQNVSDDDEKVAFEWAHASFFPNLLLNTIYDKVTKKTSKSQN